MNTIVIYDTNFGNTRRIAETIAYELGTKARNVRDVSVDMLRAADLIVIGCPINAWRPTEYIARLLSRLSSGMLSGIKAAAFDTRIKIFFSGNAARKIAQALTDAGAEIIAEPAGFYVEEKEGPLEAGELTRAKLWADMLKVKSAA